VTNTRRTQQTAAGLAQRLGLNAEVVDAKTIPRSCAACCARTAAPGAHRRAQQHRAGNRGCARRVHERAPMGEDEFDTMYVVTVPTIGKASVLRLKVLTPQAGRLAKLDAPA
jgi:hypothetical protein